MCVLSLANRQNLNDMEAEIKNIVNLLGWHLYLCSNFLFDWQYMRRVYHLVVCFLSKCRSSMQSMCDQWCIVASSISRSINYNASV